MDSKVDVLFMLDSGIGNTIQALYAVESCIQNGVDVQLYLGSVNRSFQKYLSDSYGKDIVLDSLEGVKCSHLLHSFLFEQDVNLPEHDHYYFLAGDNYFATKHKSEAELYMDLVSGIFGFEKNNSSTLSKLIEDYSDQVKELNVSDKYIFYPGGSAINPVRRWPHFKKLMDLVGGIDHAVIIGSNEDCDFSASYVYPISLSWMPQSIKNRKVIFDYCKSIHLLKEHAHWNELNSLPNSYIEKFGWAELVAIFRRCKTFIGNDGGLMHLAAAAGAKGFALFGPSSVSKNRAYNRDIKPIYKNYNCMPCQFGVGGVQMVKGFINCPYQVKCLNDISAQDIVEQLA